MSRILCVDDEPRMLDSLVCTLGLSFDVHTADGGARGLELLQTKGPFSTIISDMRMPRMSGSAFLHKARELAPASVRILLTGHADIDAAISAVNDGEIFRFLTKPITPNDLSIAVHEGVARYEQNRRQLDSLDGTDDRLKNLEAMLRKFAIDLVAAGIRPATASPTADPATLSALKELSPRESEVLARMLQGERVQGIAERLFISPHTVRNHLKSIFRKVGVNNQSDLIRRLKPSG